jgi:hypothetical protein
MSKAARRLTCERCGAAFECGRDSEHGCWCAGESFRLPMPLPQEAGSFSDCLCPSCLRKVAAALIDGQRASATR